MSDEQRQWSAFLSDIAKQVDSLIINPTKMAVFRKRITPFAERWEKHEAEFGRFEKDRVEHWQRVKANPHLQNKTVEPPEEGWEWDSGEYLYGLMRGPEYEVPAKYVLRLLTALEDDIRQNEQQPQEGSIEHIDDCRRYIQKIRSQYVQLTPKERTSDAVRISTWLDSTEAPRRAFSPPLWYRYLDIPEEAVFGCWRPPLPRVSENPIQRLTSNSAGDVPEARNKAEQYERYHVALAHIRDNQYLDFADSESITKPVWPERLIQQVQLRFFSLDGVWIGPNQKYILTALERVQANWTTGLWQDGVAFLSAVGRNVEMLVAGPESSKIMERFRSQLACFCEKWKAYRTAHNAYEDGTWTGEMGEPTNPLGALWPLAYGTGWMRREDFKARGRGFLTAVFPYEAVIRKDVSKPLADYVLLAVVHDMVLPNCIRINDTCLPNELAQEIIDNILDDPQREGDGSLSGRPQCTISKRQVEDAVASVEQDLNTEQKPMIGLGQVRQPSAQHPQNGTDSPASRSQHAEAMSRNDIVNKVHADIDFFRSRWSEFCEWVEACAKQLDEYQRRETETCRVMTQNCREVDKKWRLAGKPDDGATRQEHDRIDAEHEIVVGKMKRLFDRLGGKGWARWYVLPYPLSPKGVFLTSELMLDSEWDFYAPCELVNPVLWVYGCSNPREPDSNYLNEHLLVDCALLVVAHDANETPAKRIYHPGDYTGAYFDCESFRHKLAAMLEDTEDNGHLQRTWFDIERYAGAELKKSQGKTNGQEQSLETSGLIERLKALRSALDSDNKDRTARVRIDLGVYAGSAERLYDALQEPLRGSTADAMERLKWIGEARKSRTNTGLHAGLLDALAVPGFIEELERWCGVPTDDKQGEAYNAFQEGSGFWTITFQGKTLPPIQGREAFAYLAYMLTHPKEWISAMQVIEAVHEARAAQQREPPEIADQSDVEEEEPSSRRKGAEQQDRENKADRMYLKQCHEKLSSLRAEQQRAKDNDDEASDDRCQQEIDAILNTLKGLTGPGGRFRKFTNEVDNAYYAIRKARGRMMEKVAGHSPELLQHLNNCIHFNKPCISYQPEMHTEWCWAKPQKENT